jgi:hypothetical protein
MPDVIEIEIGQLCKGNYDVKSLYISARRMTVTSNALLQWNITVTVWLLPKYSNTWHTVDICNNILH